jgi:alcohol dehydrogenase
VNLLALRSREPDGPAVDRYAAVGRWLLADPNLGPSAAADGLVDWLTALAARLELPRLGDVGVREAEIPALVADSRGSSMRTNPIVLTDAEIASILAACS